MTMFRLGLLGSLRVAFFGAIKAALCAYILFPHRHGLCKQRTRKRWPRWWHSFLRND